MNTATEEGQQKRREELAREYMSKSYVKGDFYWRKAAEVLGTDGDYIPGYDDGETKEPRHE